MGLLLRRTGTRRLAPRARMSRWAALAGSLALLGGVTAAGAGPALATAAAATHAAASDRAGVTATTSCRLGTASSTWSS